MAFDLFGGGGGVKSVQRGTVTFPFSSPGASAAAAIQNVVIAAVDPARSVVEVTSSAKWHSSSTGQMLIGVTGNLLDATSLQLRRGLNATEASIPEAAVVWQVVEYN